jgi:hypothetical protein
MGSKWDKLTTYQLVHLFHPQYLFYTVLRWNEILTGGNAARDHQGTQVTRSHRAALLNAITSTLRVKEVKSRKSEVACVHARQHALIAELLEIALRNEHTTLAIWHWDYNVVQIDALQPRTPYTCKWQRASLGTVRNSFRKMLMYTIISTRLYR